MQLLDAFRKSPIFRNVAIRVICECLHHIMVRASLLYSYRCLAIPLNDNGNPAPFFLFCLQKDDNMEKFTASQMSLEDIQSFKKKFNDTERLYHYTSFDNAMAIIATGKLRFSQLCSLNDINEAYRPEYIGIDRTASISDFDKSFSILDKGVITKVIQKFQQISLSRDTDDNYGFAISPMWGHYAQKGTGICLVFDKNKLIKNLNPDDYGIVQYRKEMDGSIIIPLDSTEDCTGYINSHKREIFFTKTSDWSYEQEFRIVNMIKRKTNRYLDIKDAIIAVIINTNREDENILSAKCSLLNALLDSKVGICNYSSFLGTKSLSCLGETIWNNGI